MLALSPWLALIAVPMAIEAWWSSRNEARLRAKGAVEPAGDVYRIMRIVYPGMFVAMALEGAWRGGLSHAAFVAGLVIFCAAKVLKTLAILALGEFWSFKVLVLPSARLVTGGPYRYLRHPNYVALIGEIIGAALLLGAPVAGVISLVAFGLLLRARIAVEERALGLR